MTDQATNVKGFRQSPKPTKGEVLQENTALSQQLGQKIQGLQQFYGNLISQLMKQSRDQNQELSQLSIWLASVPTTDVAQIGDNLLIDYAGVVLKEDGSFDTLTVTDAEGKEAQVANFFDGGSGEMFILTKLGSGTLINGFEEQVVGLKAGEAREIIVQFPENYNVPHLAKQKAKFFVYLHEVRRVFPTSPVGSLIKQNDRIKAELRAKAETKAKEAAEAAKKAAEEPKVEEPVTVPAEAITAQAAVQSEPTTEQSPA